MDKNDINRFYKELDSFFQILTFLGYDYLPSWIVDVDALYEMIEDSIRFEDERNQKIKQELIPGMQTIFIGDDW